MVHNDSSYEQELLDRKQGLKKKYEISLLNSCMSTIIEELSNLLPTKICFGYDTKNIRNKFGLDKDHSIDGFCISLFDKDIDFISIKSDSFTIKHFKKKSNNIIQKVGSRKYYLDGKLVATNRHKAFNQKEDSLEEYLSKYSEMYSQEDSNKLFNSLIVRPAKRIYTYHKKKKISPFKCGDIVKTHLGVLIINRVRVSDNTIGYKDNKTLNFKYCTLLKSESLVFM
jgi:hypothetical protein